MFHLSKEIRAYRNKATGSLYQLRSMQGRDTYYCRGCLFKKWRDQEHSHNIPINNFLTETLKDVKEKNLENQYIFTREGRRYFHPKNGFKTRKCKGPGGFPGLQIQ